MKHNKSNHKKHYLQMHLVFVVKYRKPILKYKIAKRIKDVICDIVKTLKQKTTHEVWSHHESYLSKCFWKRKSFWSDGYFCCAVGDASTETIEHYIASQG